MKNRVKNTIYLSPTDPEAIDNIIRSMKLKNSSGHDNINSKLIKSLKNELKDPISILTNLSITNGMFPVTYKLAEVIPIYKSKNKEEINNYRPISLLPTLTKILEKIIHTVQITLRFIDFRVSCFAFAFQTQTQKRVWILNAVGLEIILQMHFKCS